MTEPASFSLQGIRIQMRLEHLDFSKVDLLSDKLSRFKKSLLQKLKRLFACITDLVTVFMKVMVKKMMRGSTSNQSVRSTFKNV